MGELSNMSRALWQVYCQCFLPAFMELNFFHLKFCCNNVWFGIPSRDLGVQTPMFLINDFCKLYFLHFLQKSFVDNIHTDKYIYRKKVGEVKCDNFRTKDVGKNSSSQMTNSFLLNSLFTKTLHLASSWWDVTSINNLIHNF